MDGYILPLQDDDSIYTDLLNLLAVYNGMTDDAMKALYLKVIVREMTIVDKLQTDILAKIQQKDLKRVK